MEKTKVVHIITSLEIGGAQTVLYNLTSYKNKSFKNIVINLKSKSELSAKFRNSNIKLYELNIRSFFSLVVGFFRLIKILKYENPHIVQTWLYHADLIGGLCSKIANIKVIIWNIRGSEINYKTSTNILIKLNSIFSYIIPKKIIFCSERSINIHKSLGYKTNSVLIRNGINTQLFVPNSKLKLKNRNEYSLNTQDFVIGMIARFDEQKDHKNLFKALKKLENLRFKCVLIGDKISNNNNKLLSLIQSYSLGDKIKILEKSTNIYQVITCLDLHVLSSSHGEGFPNVVAETMSAGIPNIVTDIGDSNLIVGQKEWVVEPKSPDVLAKKINNLYEIFYNNKRQYKKLSADGSRRISEFFSMKKMSKKYFDLWKEFI